MTNKNDGSRVARNQRARLRAVASSTVEGFPEIVARHPQCRVCGLIDSNPELLRHIHDTFLGGKGVRALETETRQPLIAMGEPMLDHKCFSRHFKAHVLFEVQTTSWARPPIVQKLDEADEDEGEDARPAKATPPAARAASLDDGDEEENLETAAYFDMRNLILKLRQRMKDIDESTAFVDEYGKINSYGLQLWLKFVDSFRATLEAMNRIKNNDRLTKAILQAHAKRQTQIVSAQLIQRFETVLAKVRRGDADALQALETLAMTEARNIVIDGARAAVEESCDVYRLH